jgi:hypothetical protein
MKQPLLISGTRTCLLLLILLAAFGVSVSGARAADHSPSFLGFDRNEYPGDSHLNELHKTFAYAGYWLNNPPGTKADTWSGNRGKIDAAGFGFLVLFNGRLYRELGKNAAAIGKSDGAAAVAAAKHEGFPSRTIIFLDQEEGGRMLPEQKAYLFAWVDAVSQSGFRAGVYCSGMAAPEKGGATIVTAVDIRQAAGDRDISYWVTNDACPPSPGCVVAQKPLSPSGSGVAFAEIWQFAQSPRRKGIAASCHGYDPDGNCYLPNSNVKLHLDLNVASSADPSHGRSRPR